MRRRLPADSTPSATVLTPEQAPQGSAIAVDSKPSDKPVALPGRAAESASLPMRTPTDILLEAIQNPSLDVVKLEKLMDLQLRWSKEEARRAYIEAMVQFKANPPTIIKNKRVGFENRDGSGTSYTHATLAEAATKIAEALSKVGISHNWDVAHKEIGIVVTCTLTHFKGHSESVEMPPVQPDNSGKKNAIQQIGSAITYMQRYSLMSITGLAAKDQDDDGAGSGEQVETLTEDEIANMQALLEDVGANKESFLKYMKVDKLGDIPRKNYKATMATIESKRGR